MDINHQNIPLSRKSSTESESKISFLTLSYTEWWHKTYQIPKYSIQVTFDLFQRWRELPDPGLIGSEGGGVKVNVLARVEAAN